MSVREGRPTWREIRIRERIAEVFEDPSTHFWLRAALETALTKDPVDAINDAKVLFLLLKERWEALREADDFLGAADYNEPR